MSVVYFVRAIGTNTVKIGTTRQLEMRLASLRTATPCHLEVVRTLEGDTRLEAWFHQQFADRRIGREWFRFCPEMLTLVPPEGATAFRRSGRAVGQKISSEYGVKMHRWVGAAVKAHGHLDRNEAIAAAAALLGLTPRRVLTFLNEETAKVWADEYQHVMGWYRDFARTEAASLKQAAGALTAESAEIDAYFALRDQNVASLAEYRAGCAELEALKIELAARLRSNSGIACGGGAEGAGAAAGRVTR